MRASIAAVATYRLKASRDGLSEQLLFYVFNCFTTTAAFANGISRPAAERSSHMRSVTSPEHGQNICRRHARWNARERPVRQG